ncbi:MAG: peptidylprolyl isomerase [Pseudomonadota bacterium]
MRKVIITTVVALCAAAPSVSAQDKDGTAPVNPVSVLNAAPEDAWRSLDPENTIYMDLPAGLIIIEMRPDLAPGHANRLRELTREGFYNGLNFHRVIEGFVAQGGDPAGDGTGGSDKPDIAGEFTKDASAVENFTVIGRDRIAPRVGYIDGMPVAAQPEALRSFLASERVNLWALHCPGVMSMARATNPNSANSQFFLMIGDARANLDQRYTAWGWIVDGYEASRRIVRGEPPSRPTPIMRMRIASDVPEKDRRDIKVMRTDSDVFMNYLRALGEVDDSGFVKDICDIKVPTRVDGKIER